MVGDILSTIGDPEGRGRLSATSARRRPVRRGPDKLAWSYQTAGDKPMALKIARETVATAPESRERRSPWPICFRADEEYADSYPSSTV